jgi:fermentation-respiration switch protein FrsA (DUF1100 family)
MQLTHRRRITLLSLPFWLGIAYFGAGLVLYTQVTAVEGSCGQHAVNRPDSITFLNHWPPIDVSQYVMPGYELVRFPSRDPRIMIAGWYVAGDPGGSAVILTHGLDGCKNAVDILVPAGMLWRNGFSVLMIDLRDVGDSSTEDGFTSAGNEEYLDVLGAWDWVVTEKGYAPGRIGLYGGSMGGATSLYAFSHEPRVAALFLQAAFEDVLVAYEDNLNRYGLPRFLGPPTALMGKLVSSEHLLEHRPADEIKSAGGRPVYIVHTQADHRIGVWRSRELAAAAREAGVHVTTWFPESGEHLQAPAVYPEEFERRMVGFFQEALQ